MLRNFLQRTISVYWQARAAHVFHGLNLQRTDRLLEIGCGQGLWTEIFAARSGFMAALDIEMNMITQARSRAPNASYILASADALPFKREAFDKLACLDVIADIPDDQHAAHEMARVLRDHGRAVITTLIIPRWTPFDQLKFSEYLREYNVTQLTALFENPRWRIVDRFFFYRRWATFAREAQMKLFDQHWHRAWMPLYVILQIGLSILGAFDPLSRMKPGGVGLALDKTQRTQEGA
jgi:ubiquinone/menaquinone biosynthesis C-methylase UbiE